MSDPQVQLVAEQLRRLRDNIESRMERIEAGMNHRATLENERWRAYQLQLEALRQQVQDHEARLRDVRDGVTSYRTWSTLTGGGSLLTALIALLRAFLGG